MPPLYGLIVFMGGILPAKIILKNEAKYYEEKENSK